MTRRLAPGEFAEPWIIDLRDEAYLASLTPTMRAKRKKAVKRYLAQQEYADGMGRRRVFSSSGATKGAASRALERKRTKIAAELWRTTDITGDTTVKVLFERWLADRRERQDARRQTLDQYEYEINAAIVPIWGTLRIGTVTTGNLLAGLREIERRKQSRQVRVVLGMGFRWAVQVGALPTSPVTALTGDRSGRRKRAPKPRPRSLTNAELDSIIDAVAAWEDRTDSTSGPKTNGYLGLIVATWIETGARIGEVLAVRRSESHLRGPEPYLAFTGTLVEPRRAGDPPLFRQEATKSDADDDEDAGRDVGISIELAARLDAHLKAAKHRDLAQPLFANRKGGFLWPANVRRMLRTAVARHAPEVIGLHPHLFRSTVATVVADRQGLEAAADLLGHSSTRTTARYYIERRRKVVRGDSAIREWRQQT